MVDSACGLSELEVDDSDALRSPASKDDGAMRLGVPLLNVFGSDTLIQLVSPGSSSYLRAPDVYTTRSTRGSRCAAGARLCRVRLASARWFRVVFARSNVSAPTDEVDLKVIDLYRGGNSTR